MCLWDIPIVSLQDLIPKVARMFFAMVKQFTALAMLGEYMALALFIHRMEGSPQVGVQVYFVMGKQFAEAVIQSHVAIQWLKVVQMYFAVVKGVSSWETIN